LTIPEKKTALDSICFIFRNWYAAQSLCDFATRRKEGGLFPRLSCRSSAALRKRENSPRSFAYK